MIAPSVTRIETRLEFSALMRRAPNHDSSDSRRRRQRSRYYPRWRAARVYQIFDIRNSHLAGGQVWRCPFTLTFAFDTFGKSFRRNIIQRGVKLQPRRPVGRAGRIFQLTTLFRNGYGPMRVACTDTPVRAAFVVPFGFYGRVPCRRSAPSRSLFPFSPSLILCGCWWFFLLHSPRVSIAGRNAPKRDFDIPPPYGKPCNDVTSFAI